jgi:hypothetical protein
MWKWLIGPIGTDIVMLLLVPSNADVFYYEISGHVANQNFNPYVYPIYDFPTDPAYPYNHWVEMSSVYGPFWTDICRAVMGVTGPDPVLATLVFKIMLGTVALALAVLVYVFAMKLTGNRALACAAGVLVAWEPNMMMETSGQAHNDPLMVLLMTAGVMLAVVGGTRAIRGGIVLVTASAAIKYVTLPVLGLLALPRLLDRREPHGWRRVAISWALDGIAVAATLVAAFLPYWDGPKIFNEMLSEPSRNFSHPIWTVPLLLLSALTRNSVSNWYMTIIRTASQVATLAVLVYVFWTLGKAIWNRRPPPSDQAETSDSALPWWTGRMLFAWCVAICALAFIPTNIHSWYWTWPVAPVALLMAWNGRHAETDAAGVAKLPRWFWLYLVVTALFTLMDVTRVPTW